MTPVFTLERRIIAETLGSALLLAIVVGSGIMADKLAGGNSAIALLANTLATASGLVVLITIFGPISGAHFNPAVTLIFFARRDLSAVAALLYVAAQTVGAVLGVWVAHVMFALPILQISSRLRDGPAQVFSEAIASFGLIATILGSLRFKPEAAPILVGLYIAAAYWFTASTSFANPAVTIARSLSDSFAGIAPSSVPMFIFGQLVGAIAAGGVFVWLLKEERQS